MMTEQAIKATDIAREVLPHLGDDWTLYPLTEDDKQESADWWKRRSLQHKTRPYHITFSDVGTWGAGRGKMHISGDPGVRPHGSRCSFSLREIVNPYAEGYNARDYDKSINVSPTKGADKIAKDIVRRLLPGLERFTAACEKRRAEQVRYAEDHADTLGRVAAAIGGNVRTEGYKAGEAIDGMPDGFRFEHSSDSSVTLSVSLTAAEWEKIGPAIKAL